MQFFGGQAWSAENSSGPRLIPWTGHGCLVEKYVSLPPDASLLAW